MLLTTAVALALSGSIQAAPAPELPMMEPAALVQYLDGSETGAGDAEEQKETGDIQTPQPDAQEADPDSGSETIEQPAQNNTETGQPQAAGENVASVESLPGDIARAAEGLQGEIVTVLTPPAPEPEPPKPAKPAAPTNQQLYGTVLGTYTTSYSTSQTKRCTNIRLAATAISGTVLQPGETFSFNSVVGKRTAARGYQVAHVYSGGKVVEGIGGGICQVSSTLFNAALLSNMTITSRTSHGLPVSYLPAGRDATVSWGGPEFKFKNPYSFPVKITAGYDSGKGTITCSILGPDTQKAPNVKIAVTKSGGKYITKRSVDGSVNYTTTSVYK